MYQESDAEYYDISISPDPNNEGTVRIDRVHNSHEFAGLTAGTSYTLSAEAYNDKDTLIAEGRTEGIQVTPGVTTPVTVTMVAKTYHVHDFATEWTTDAAYHWHAATCGDTEETRDKGEHSFGEWITVTPATEENEGQKKRTCTVCNYEETETIPLLNHTHTWAAEWKYDESNHWHECTSSKCSEKDQFAAHTWDNGTQTKPATCTADGVKTYTCTVCHATRTEAIPATGVHAWGEGDVATQPTCTAEGVMTYECTVCHATKTEVIPATGEHTWDAGVVTTQPTCTEDGVKTYTCNKCGQTKTEPITATGHNWSEDWEQSETEHWHKCTHDGCTEKTQVEGHKWDNGTEITAATCTETGILTYTCTDCYATKTEVIPATGHNPGSTPVTITKEPTCFTDGEQQYTCLICGETVTEPIPALGWCETPIDAETFMPATKSSTSVYFGVFPQTVLPSESSVTVNESESVTMGTQTYYKGSDGEYYVQTSVVPYKTDYKYKDETTVSSGTRYFRMEPLKWIILATDYDVDGTNGDETAALLLANNVLTAGQEVQWYETTTNHNTENTPWYFYKDSQARAYLNGISYDAATETNDSKWVDKGFLQQAFTDTAKENIEVTSVDNARDVLKTGDPTNDKIFLLSLTEYNTYKRLIVNNHTLSDYALAKGAVILENNFGDWCLRSSSNSGVDLINDHNGGTSYFTTNHKYIGFSPALCIDLPDAN